MNNDADQKKRSKRVISRDFFDNRTPLLLHIKVYRNPAFQYHTMHLFKCVLLPEYLMEKEEVGGGHHHQVEEEDLVVIEADLNDIQNSDCDVFALVAARVSFTLIYEL